MTFENKAGVRRYIKELKEKLDASEIDRRSEAVIARLVGMDVYKAAEHVFLYASYNQEVNTFGLMKTCLRDKKNVYLPRVISKETMEFYKIDSLDDLEAGYMGISEPKIGIPISEVREGFFLMPGLAFDKDFHRIGYGGGFYDRYLERDNEFIKVAVAFDFQLLDEIPTEKYDLKPDYIVTENKVLMKY